MDSDTELIVVWNGSMRAPLLPPRSTKPDLTWEPPRRLYNRKAPLVVIGAHEATPGVEETTVETTPEDRLYERLDAIEAQQLTIIELLETISEKLDNLNLSTDEGYGIDE